MDKKKALKKVLNFYTIVGGIFWAIALLLILTPILPYIWYTAVPSTVNAEVVSLTQNLDQDYNAFAELRAQYTVVRPVQSSPPLDESLTKQNTIKIGQIGLNSPIKGGEDWSVALEKGTWIVPNFGTPANNDRPIIFAAHRFGGLNWSIKDRNTKSFYKLPEIKNGDTIEIIWKQRSYLYQVYRGTEGTKITDYDADLILYTCKLYWESPVRIFRYAKRIN